MSEIPLTKGQIAIVDDEDYSYLAQWKWHAVRAGQNTFYAARSAKLDCNGKRPLIWMHRVILDAPSGVEVDHRNRNTLDNRRLNLRLATHSENGRNCGVQRRRAGSFKGVGLLEGKWAAHISVDGKLIHLGLFNDQIEAAKAYDFAAHALYGDFARPNFE